MSSQRTLRRAVVAAMLMVAFLFQGTWALAGTTGNIAGNVRDSSGAPIAGAQVKAVSPSQTATATTDAGGRFTLLSLSPDTYTLNVSKQGYADTSEPGTVVFADQTQQVSVTLAKQLITIGHVTAQGAGSLVKSGVSGDLYSVNATAASKAAVLSGGSNLNNTYSAMATVPGVQVNVGGAGWTFNAAYVRGQNSYYTGFEYDGIPVNRAFDNYNASTESSLGLQELQVYTGGGPSSVASAGTAGFINQVIKTGTFPGFASGLLGIGTDAFYHSAQVEVGGATPDRNFSYYAAFSGNNQAFRFINPQNAGDLMEPNGLFSGPTGGFSPGYSGCRTATCQGVKASCPLLASPFSDPSIPAQGCWGYYNGLAPLTSEITDRENVVNFHFGIPKKNGLRDDVQLLWSASALNNWSYGSINDIGTSVQQFGWNEFGAPYAAPLCNQAIPVSNGSVNGCAARPGTGYLAYADNIAYNLPFGTTIATNASNIKFPQVYFAPDTPAHPYLGGIPTFGTSLNSYQNTTGITKLQYTFALSQSAYLRAYGYTFYSDWLQVAPVFGATFQGVPSLPAAQYQLITHTAGGALEFNDQINDQNLIGANANYSQATVNRFNNSSAIAGTSSPIGYMSTKGGKFTCFDPSSGGVVPCISSGYQQVTATGGIVATAPAWRGSAIGGPTGFAAAGTPAARAGASWDTLWSGNATGAQNNVQPRFFNASLSDQWRPNDKILVNAALRYDDFTYDLPDSATAATQFYASQTANFTCILKSTNQVLQAPLAPGQVPPASAVYVNGDCNTAARNIAPSGPHSGWVHPNGTVQDGVTAPNFTAASPSSYSLNYWQPRVSATYTQNPDTVWRLSAGRYTQPPISASVQYLSASGDNRSLWNNMMNLGFYSPFHPIPGISSAQYDMSFEKHLHGTDMSFKLSPFYTWVNQWQQQTFIGAGFVTQVPVGVNRNYGMEFQFNKGDFSRDGLSGQFAFTWTNSKVQFQNEPLSSGGTVPNTTIQLNQVIAQYNSLTKSGGGSPCYRNAVAVSCSAKPITIGSQTFDVIQNPYYNQPSQGELDPNGWYNPYTTAIAPNLNGAVTSYISPLVSSLIVNYRHHKLAVTPSLQFQSGGFYGSPLDINGIDPRTCMLNSAGSGITKVSPKTNPLQCNYLATNPLLGAGTGQFGYFYIPNPQTGHFAAIGSYQNPSLFTGNLQLTYEATPKLTVTLTGANIFHTCFGGSSEPWTAANQPGPNICGYFPAGGVLNSTIYPANFYNGTGINDFAANKVHTPFQQSYFPVTGNNGGIGGALQPFNLYITAQMKL
jgi:hypothetical protein